MKCTKCTKFFLHFACNRPDECDCPKCQGLCECPDAGMAEAALIDAGLLADRPWHLPTLRQEALEALRKYRAKHGRCWKSKLRHCWLVNGPEDEGAIRLARNIIGPRGLDKVKL